MSEQADPKSTTSKPPRKRLPWQDKQLKIGFPLGVDCDTDIERTGL